MALDPDKLFGKDDPMKIYKLQEELAVGSYGRVYRVQDKKTNNVCALKVIPLEENDALDDFLPEISIMKTTTHPNLVKFHGAWMKKRELFIAMELCGGGAGNDLYQSTGKALPEPIICYIIRETTKALSYCHENAIMHRDIKAANILFTEGGDVKLTDFGVSCQMASPLDKRKTYIGTPYWVAPEIIMVNCLFKPAPLRAVRYDNKVDIWSLGITVIELAETRPPHFNLRATRAMMEIPRAPAPKLTQPGNWSPEMVDFIARCTEKDPDKRASAKQLLAHSWFGRAADRAKLAEYIRQIRAAKKGQAELAASGPPAPSVSSSTAAAAAAVLSSPSVASHGGSGGSGSMLVSHASDSHYGTQGSGSGSGIGFGTPSEPPAFDDEAPLSASDLVPTLRRADSKLNVDDLLRPDRAVAADRPVAKARALSAQHDILVKRLQKQHIQELKKLLKEHMKAQDVSQREVDLQRPKSAAALIRKKEAVKDDEVAIAKEQIAERENLQRKQMKEMETHIRMQGLERKQLLKELRDKQSGQAAELAVYARGGEGNMKYQLELEALRLDYELALKHEAATHAVASQHLIELYALARAHYKKRKSAREDMLKRLQAIEFDHLTGELSVQLRFLQQTHGRQRDLLELTHGKQREHMKKQQELQTALHVREFRDDCAKRDREWMRSREQESKNSAEIKRAMKARQEQNVREEERLCQRLLETIAVEHRREEEDQVAQHAKMKELQVAAQKKIEAAMEKDHRDKQNMLNEDHKKQKLAFLQRSRKFQLDMLSEHQAGLLHALEELHRAQNNSTNEYFVALKDLKRKFALALDFGESISTEQIDVGKKLSEAQIEEKKRAIEQGASAVQALMEQLDQEASELEMAISGDLFGTARARTLTAGRQPQQAFSFGTARSATLSRMGTGMPAAAATGLPPSAATGLPGALSPRGRAQTGGELPEEGYGDDGDASARRSGRRGTDSVLFSPRDSTPLSALLQPQKFDPTAALRGPATGGRAHTTRPDSVMAPAALEASRVTVSPEEARRLAAAMPKNPLYNAQP